MQRAKVAAGDRDECLHVSRVIAVHGISGAARRLRVHRTTLHSWLRTVPGLRELVAQAEGELE